MANKAAPSLMGLPLEVRHAIFAQAADSQIKHRRLLRYWFEKQDAKQQVAELAAKDPAAVPQLIYNADSYDGDSEVSDEDDDEIDQEDAEDEDEDQDDDEAEDEDDQDEAEDDQDEVMDEDGDDDDEAMDSEDDGDDDDEALMDQIASHQADLSSAQLQLFATQTTSAALPAAPAVPGISSNTQPLDQDAMEHDKNGEDQQDDMVDNEPDQEAEPDEEQGEVDHDATQQAQQHSTYIYVHAKWRHIPSFMRLTLCPPPTELLLVSKQLNVEAKDWFYDVAVLHIEATASFAHTSFFEETFSQITDAAFSPMENIRKVHVTFIWDSTWIRDDDTGCVEAIFPALLRQRTDFIIKILQQAPDLDKVTVHWHDSAEDAEATALRVEIYECFLSLPAKVEFKEHFIAHDATPHRKGVAGRRRVEFQNIVDNGLDRLL